VVSLGLSEGVEPEWTLDGQSLLYSYRDPDAGSYDFYRLSLESDSAEPLHERGGAGSRGRSVAHEVASPRLSPTGELLAYSSDESGSFEIYVETYPEGTGRRQVSTDGGEWPRWSRDGASLYFLSDDRLTATRVLDLSPLTFSTPEILFSLSDRGLVVGDEKGFEVGPDESFFLCREVDEAASRTSLALVQNWFAEFEDTR
jgi:Tol biopolymer transport system component